VSSVDEQVINGSKVVKVAVVVSDSDSNNKTRDKGGSGAVPIYNVDHF
jgi:hypothetical protein